ncbi:MAG: ComEC/Rec2 family competence protein [Desulfitobacteriaceae bacterium]|nr:ComEC/Rec2 family competence protein [Desulfitobacteriaceae bacterium]
MESSQRKRVLAPFLSVFLAVLTLLPGCSSASAPVDNPKPIALPAAAVTQNAGTLAPAPPTSKQPDLRITFLDVGQGDSIFIQTPHGKTLLIDAGDNTAGPKVTAYLQDQGIKRLDAVVWTHPHADHIGGADMVTQAFSIGQVYMPKVSANTEAYRDLLKSMQGKHLKALEAKAGLTLDLDPEVKAQFLAPSATHYEDTNDYSAVLRLTYGENSFLFTGDAQTTSEQEMLAGGYILKADVLKVGHHGSHSSTSSTFLAKVQPGYAVISVGQGNDYGHPHKETLAALAKAGIKVYRTDESGSIIAESDGKKISFTTLGGHP